MTKGRPKTPEHVAAERRRRWQEEVAASGLLAEQIARVVRKSIPTVWSYNSESGVIPAVAAINSLARHNLARAESEVIRLGFFDLGSDGE